MKKNYNSPIITVVKLKMQTSVMQASLKLKNENANSAAMSREGGDRANIWDDDEE